jgi:radical SAM protein with 4Fe4S-binding SPASM domain
MIKKCEEMGIEYVTLIKLKKGSLDEKTFEELVPSYEEYGQIIEKLCYRKNEKPNVTIDCASISNLQHTLKDEEMKTIPTAGCPIGHNLICIAPNGDIYPCAALMEEQFKLGNILTDDFKKMWKENQILRNFRNIKNKVEGRCKTCKRLDFCRGGCRGIAQSLNKSLYASDGSCEFKQ